MTITAPKCAVIYHECIALPNEIIANDTNSVGALFLSQRKLRFPSCNGLLLALGPCHQSRNSNVTSVPLIVILEAS